MQNGFKKVVYNNLHTFMRESGDPRFEKLQCYLTINKLYGHIIHNIIYYFRILL